MVAVAHRVDGPEGAPVLLLANSLGTTWDMWGPQIPALTARFRVVRYDHRGHGASPCEPGPYRIEDLAGDALGLLDRLGVERASVCGLSLGGMVAMWLAAHAPERVDRLVLCCTSPVLTPASQWAERAATVRADGVTGLLDALLGRWFTSRHDRAGDAALVTRMLAAVQPEGYAGCCEAIASMDLSADLAAIRAETLVVAGAEDPVVPPAAAVGVHERIAGSGLAVIAGAAHLANLEQPDRFTRVVLDHLAGTEVERGRRVRRQVLGDAHVDRAEAGTTPMTAPFQDLITRYAWGEIWTRPGLDRATRSCVTIAMLVALGRFDELALHVRGARRNGVTEEEITEVLLHAAIYCGAPAANSAFAVAERALRED